MTVTISSSLSNETNNNDLKSSVVDNNEIKKHSTNSKTMIEKIKSDLQSSSSVMKSEQVKHHIPHDSISWVYQEDDVICAILLLYNPITRCPVHIHAYRCDSIQTANNLHQQLQTLIDRPENQKKFREIEMRLAAKGLLIPPMQPQPCGPLQLAPLPLPPLANIDAFERYKMDSFNSAKPLRNSGDNLK